jgi:hypothetical protein
MKYYSTKANAERSTKNLTSKLPMEIIVTSVSAQNDPNPTYDSVEEADRGGKWFGIVVLDHNEDDPVLTDEVKAQLTGFEVMYEPESTDEERAARVEQKTKPAKARADGKERERSSIGSPVKVVWETATAIIEENPEATRKEIIDACLAKGVNKATAATQYAKWKKERQGA